MNIPTISVLLPAYNCSQYIAEAINSILAQTYRDFELIIINDCSTDTTAAEIAKFDDPRIVYIAKEVNSGISESLNIGIERARGKYIARMDADDFSVAERFEEQLAVLEAHHNIVVCGSVLKVYGSEIIIDKPERHEEIQIGLLHGCPIAHPSVMVRAHIMNRFKYDSTMEPAEDYDLWTKLIWEGEMYNIQKPLLYYRFHDAQISSVSSRQQRRMTALVRAHYFNKVGPVNGSVNMEVLEKYFLTEQLEGSEFKALLFWLDSIRGYNIQHPRFPEPAFSLFVSSGIISLIKSYFSTHRRGGSGLVLWFSLPPKYFFEVFRQHLRYGFRMLGLNREEGN